MPAANKLASALRGSSYSSIGLSTKNNTYVNVNKLNSFIDAKNSKVEKALAFFSSISSIRKKTEEELLMSFKSVLDENLDIGIRMLLWLRDARCGAGERNAFRIIINALSFSPLLENIVEKIPMIGRFDDLLLEWKSEKAMNIALTRYVKGFYNENEVGLAAKWAPRKGVWVYRLRKELGLSPSDYRKFIVSRSQTVESMMCNNEWTNIAYENVPSIAHKNYRKAFIRHDLSGYREYLGEVESGTSKINSRIEPYSLAAELCDKGIYDFDPEFLKSLNLQFSSSEYLFDESITVLPIVDVSPSMKDKATKTLSCKTIAMSMGLNLALKQKGPFSGLVMTFSENPLVIDYKGKSFSDCIFDLKRQDWGMSTNLISSFELLFKKAKDNKVKDDKLPDVVVVFSDMMMNDSSVKNYSSQTNAIKTLAKNYGYKKIPKILFWNLNINSHKGTPTVAKSNDGGVLTVSGFSSNIIESMSSVIMNEDIITPEIGMLNTLLCERYNYF